MNRLFKVLFIKDEYCVFVHNSVRRYKLVVVPECIFVYVLTHSTVDIAISALVEMGFVQHYVVHIMNCCISTCMVSYYKITFPLCLATIINWLNYCVL